MSDGGAATRRSSAGHGDEPLADGQPEAGAVRLRREVRIEDAATYLFRDARPRVADLHRDDASLRAALGGLEVDCEVAAGGHRLQRVLNQVDEDLLKQARVSGHEWAGGRREIDAHVPLEDLAAPAVEQAP